MPSEAVRILRAKLIFEEALETIEALGVMVCMGPMKYVIKTIDTYGQQNLDFHIHGEPNLEQIVDGCCDIMVVTTGTLSACGIADVGPQKLVDDSNLAKFEPPKCPFCLAKLVQRNDGRWSCNEPDCGESVWQKEAGPYRRDDGKWIKPPYWKAPNLGGEVAEQTKEVEAGLKAADEYFNKKNEDTQYKCPDCGEPMRYVKASPESEYWLCPNSHKVLSDYFDDPGRKGKAMEKAAEDTFQRWLNDYCEKTTLSGEAVWAGKDLQAAFEAGRNSAVKAEMPLQQQERILPTEGRIDTVSLTTGQAAEPREYPSYNPSAYKVNVAGACADILLDGHPGWWASIDKPKGLFEGMSVEFINSMSGKTLIHGKVSELVPPGTGNTNYRWEGKDFKDWWIIIYEVEDKRPYDERVYNIMWEGRAEGIQTFTTDFITKWIGIDEGYRGLDILWREGRIKKVGANTWELVET